MKRENNKFIKLMTISIFFALFFVSVAQAIVNFNDPETINPLVDPYFVWEDDFDSVEFIDPDPSFSYDFELVDGTVQIKNTYDIWTDPSWTCLKPIEMTNNLGQTLTNYAVHLTVDYDSDMRLEYQDIRFKHENSTSS